SIAEIVQHLIYWNEVWQLRYEQSNVNVVQTLDDNADTFLMPKDKSFTAHKDQLLDVLLRWQDLITERRLESNRNGVPVKAEWRALIGTANTQNAYQIRQIAYIRKMNENLSECRVNELIL